MIINFNMPFNENQLKSAESMFRQLQSAHQMHFHPCPRVPEFSSSSKQLKKAKKAKSSSLLPPSSKSIIMSDPEDTMNDTSEIFQTAKSNMNKHECDCGTTFTKRKNLLRHHRNGCRIYSILRDVRNLHMKVTAGLAPLTEVSAQLKELLEKQSLHESAEDTLDDT
jgi:hypothetical protein